MLKINFFIMVMFGCAFQSYVKANEQLALQLLGEQAVILCTAERNVIRFETYVFDDFRQEQLFLSKKERDKHCILELNMQQEGINLLGISWKEDMPGHIAV